MTQNTGKNDEVSVTSGVASSYAVAWTAYDPATESTWTWIRCRVIAGRMADEEVSWGLSPTPEGLGGRESNARNPITHERRPADRTACDGATDKGCAWLYVVLYR